MLAAVLHGAHDARLEDWPRPVLHNNTDVIVKVTGAMPCTSDVHFLEGHMPPSPPFVLGHEFVGVVEEIGSSVRNVAVGDRVAAPSFASCGVCQTCRSGQSGLCPSGQLFGSGEGWGGLGGGMAEYVRAPFADNVLLKLPDDITDEQGVFLPDMLATGYFGVRNAEVQAGQTIAVLGAGPVGLCAIATARLLSPAKVIAVGRRTNRLNAAVTMGATDAIDTAVTDPAEEIQTLTDGRGVDAVIDAVGSPESIRTAASLIRAGGTLSLIGFAPPGDFPYPLNVLTFKNATVRSGLTDQTNMPYLMDLVRSGELDIAPLLTHVLPLSEFTEAFSMFAEKKDNCLKVMLKP